MKICFTEKRFFEWHEDNVSVTLRNKSGSYGGGSETIVIEQEVFENHSNDSRYRTMGDKCQTLSSRLGTGGNNQPLVVCIGNGKAHTATHITEEVSQTLNCMHDPMAILKKNTVRRLTPTECEILQGYPVGWTLIGDPEEVEVTDYKITYDENGDEVSKEPIGTHKEVEYFYIDRNGKRRKCSDSARYKALGNSIAIPFWFYLLRRISAMYERPAMLGSLFDGLGGFPLAWERCNGEGTAVWASEVEDYPIEVTRRRFPDEAEK